MRIHDSIQIVKDIGPIQSLMIKTDRLLELTIVKGHPGCPVCTLKFFINSGSALFSR
jgi:hypothetical protein